MGKPVRLNRHTLKIAATISRRVAEIRRARRLSLQDVADGAGISKAHVWEIESGRAKNPTIETVVALATALGVSLDYLTGISKIGLTLHPEAMRIASEIDLLLRKAGH
jgi:transcriptional regulator with XRE-family HTH domain